MFPTFPIDGKGCGAISFRVCYEEEDIVQIPKCINEIFIDEDYCSHNVKIEKDDTVIDGGAYVGIFSLYAFAKGAKKVISIEPNKRKFGALLKTFQENAFNDDRWEIYNRALWFEEKYLRFRAHSPGPMSSMVAPKNARATYEVKSMALDNYGFDKETINFIKLDVEGSEVQALFGMRDLIAKNKPKMAISLYHHPSDIIVIPEVLKALGYDDPVEIKGKGKYKVGIWNHAD
jgi:FkbM family methyltransferase